jgi:hypothetical protein
MQLRVLVRPTKRTYQGKTGKLKESRRERDRQTEYAAKKIKQRISKEKGNITKNIS